MREPSSTLAEPEGEYPREGAIDIASGFTPSGGAGRQEAGRDLRVPRVSASVAASARLKECLA